jgi:rhodanese-related sulfurtransferase
VERDVDPRAAEALVSEGAVLVDVREPGELRTDGRIAGAQNVPLTQFSERAQELPETGALVLICRSGSRSAMAADALRVAGREAHSVSGGIEAWKAAGLPVE